MTKIFAWWILVFVGVGLIPVLILGASPGGIDLAPTFFVACLMFGLLGASIHSVIKAYRDDSISSKKAAIVFILSLSFILFQVFIISNEKPVSRELEPLARKAVEEYLTARNLPIEKLREYELAVSPKPDFRYLYTGAGRCMGLIVDCNDNSCRHIGTYPFDGHEEKCPGD